MQQKLSRIYFIFLRFFLLLSFYAVDRESIMQNDKRGQAWGPASQAWGPASQAWGPAS